MQAGAHRADDASAGVLEDDSGRYEGHWIAGRRTGRGHLTFLNGDMADVRGALVCCSIHFPRLLIDRRAFGTGFVEGRCLHGRQVHLPERRGLFGQV